MDVQDGNQETFVYFLLYIEVICIMNVLWLITRHSGATPRHQVELHEDGLTALTPAKEVCTELVLEKCPFKF